MNKKAKQFIETYKLFQEDTIQQIQLQHRFALVEAFQINPGMRVLEIGCGQGDTTVILADAVGVEGSVVAIDIAPANYGAPFTLGQAQDLIKQSPLGPRISFHLETDFIDFPAKTEFDVVVLSHCSWYFTNESLLAQYFKKMRTITKRVCFAEWDMAFGNIAQRSHFCAVSILALYSQFVENDGNIQHVFGKNQISQFAKDAGFTVSHEQIVDASYLQDGFWERNYANSLQADFDKAPPMIRSLVASYYEVMNSVSEYKSLNSFVLLLDV